MDLVTYIAPMDPGFAAALKPATPQEIERLEKLVGHPIPQAQRELLQLVGHGFGKHLLPGKDFSVDCLIRWYENRKNPLPERLTLLAEDSTDSNLDLFLEDIPGEPPQVVRFYGYMKFNPDRNGYAIVYQSLEQMLFGLAFQSFKMDRLAFRATLQTKGNVDPAPKAREKRLASFNAIAQQMKLTPIPHTGGWFPCYESATTGMFCYQPPLLAPYYRVAGATEREAFHLAEVLVDHLNLMITDR